MDLAALLEAQALEAMEEEDDKNDSMFEEFPVDLHFERCKGRSEDVLKMQEILNSDPESLNRKQSSSDVSKMTYTYLTPLQDASMLGHVLCVEFLLKAGADIHERGFLGDCALHFAWRGLSDNIEDCQKVCKILLEKGSNPNFSTSPNEILISRTIFEAADKHENEALVIMLNNGAYPQDMIIAESGKICPSISSNNPLSSAVRAMNVEGFRILLFHGAMLFMKSMHPSNVSVNISIPHHIIENYTYNTSTDEIFKALNVFQQFGGNLWATTLNSNRQNVTALDVLRSRPELNILNPGLEEELDKMMRQPMSLKCISRLKIRNTMGLNFWKNIKHLEIPSEMQEFLHFLITGDYKYNQM